MTYTYPLTLDIYSANSTYRAKQNDAGSRYLLATINANGVLQTVPATATVSLKVVKPDDTKTLTAGTVSNGKILVELTNQTLAVPGMAYCELQIIESNPTTLLKTIRFQLLIDAEVYSDTVAESTDEFTALTEALADVNEVKNDIATLEENQGTMADLTTTADTLVGAINELDSEKEPNLPATPLLPTEKFLNGNKEWAVPAHNKLTDLNADAEYQHMSSAEKTKLNTIARGSVRVGLTNNVAGDLVAKTDKQILIGDGNDLKSVAVSGDITISNTGVTAIGNNKVTNAKLAQMNTKTIKGNDTAVTANAKDLTVAETKALLDIDDLEAQVNSVPVSGTSKALTKSLSNTSAGITQALTVKGLTATQLVQNGNFANGTTGWTPTYGTGAVINGNYVLTTDGIDYYYSYIRQQYSFISGIHYAKIRYRVTNSSCKLLRLRLAGGYIDIDQTNPVENQWYEKDIVKNIPIDELDYIKVEQAYVDAETANGKVMEVDYLYVVNLTTTFGAGNEPNLATCQTLFPSYFDGTKSVDKGEVTVGTGTAITRARYPKLQSVPAIQDTYNVLSGLHTQNIQSVATTSGTAINTTNYPLAKNAVGFVIALDAGGTQTGIVGTDSASGDGILYYQLDVPILTYYPPKSIPLEINSSIIHQSIMSDIAFYATEITISDSDYPISSLQEVFKVSEADGAETPIDIATCTVAVDGLSFTSMALTDGDLVWFRYEHTLDSAVPTTEYTYTTSIAGGLTTIQQDVKKQNESLQKQIDELRAIIASMAV